MTMIPILVRALGTATKGLEKYIGGIGNHKKNPDQTDHSIAKAS